MAFHGITAGRLLIALPIAVTCAALAQFSGGEFEFTRSTIDAGGGTSTGGAFELTGTIAQPEANAQQSGGGDFVLAGGFWANASDLLFANGFEEG